MTSLQMRKTLRKILRAVADYDPDYYDMYADPNETFFAQLYLQRILRHADAAGLRPPAAVLDAGCQAGRIAVPLAQRGFAVTGIDTSGYALRRAREHAGAAGVTATFVRGDLLEVLRGHPDWQFEMVVCAEVLYLSPRYREMLGVLAASVKPGGLLCVSHRPKGYYLLEALRQGDLDAAGQVLTRTEGPFRESRYYNWQTLEELQALYGSLGLQWLASYSIDRFAWLSGVDPSKLTEAQRQGLLDLELQMLGDGTACSRYLLVVTRAEPQVGG